MSDPQPPGRNPNNSEQPESLPPSEEEQGAQGPSLKLLYTILVLFLGAAILMAMLIVLPFWRRH